MGLLDKAKALASEHEDAIDNGIDTAVAKVKEKAGSHADKVEKAGQAAKSALDKLTDDKPNP